MSRDVINGFVLFHSDTDSGVIAVKRLAPNVGCCYKQNPLLLLLLLLVQLPTDFMSLWPRQSLQRQPGKTQSAWKSSINCVETRGTRGIMVMFHSTMKSTLTYLQWRNFLSPRWRLSQSWHNQLQDAWVSGRWQHSCLQTYPSGDNNTIIAFKIPHSIN